MRTKGNNTTGHASEQSFLTKLINLLGKIVDPLSKYSSIFIALILSAMMFLTFIDVCGRYFLTRPVPGAYEISTFMMGIMVSFALAYTASKKAHIRVDIITQFIRDKKKAWFDLVAYGLAFIFYVLVVWQGVLHAVTYIRNKQVSGVLYIPIYPFIFIMVIGLSFIVLVFLRNLLESIQEVTR